MFIFQPKSNVSVQIQFNIQNLMDDNESKKDLFETKKDDFSEKFYNF